MYNVPVSWPQSSSLMDDNNLFFVLALRNKKHDLHLAYTPVFFVV